MNQYMKYLSSVDLIGLANQVVANIVPQTNSNCERVFDQLYKWRPFKDGFEEAKAAGKPIFLLFHKLTCPACQKLKIRLTKSIRLIELSKQFTMIKVEVGKETIDDENKFQPDGKYVPRILFFTADGDFIEEAYNHHLNPEDENKYFYTNPTHVIDTMLTVLRYCKKPLTVALKDIIKGNLSESYEVEDDYLSPTMLD